MAANLTSTTRPGQLSGFVPVTGTEAFPPVYNLLVNDTKPIWIYCGQATHCAKGMAMVINQNRSDTAKTLENYKLAAAKLLVGAGSSASTSTSTVVSLEASTTTLAAFTTTTDTAVFGSVGGATTSTTLAVASAATSIATVAATSVAETLTPPIASVAASSIGVAPATFTGAAIRQEVMGSTGLVGLLLAGFMAL